MTAPERKKTTTIPTAAIAPCGIDCRLCWAHIRDRNACPGCRSTDGQKTDSRTRCRIKNCDRLATGKSRYCSDRCGSFPCARLKQLDVRYRTKYGMSTIENLRQIREVGIRQFVRNEKARWRCARCGDLLCVHKPACLACGHAWR